MSSLSSSIQVRLISAAEALPLRAQVLRPGQPLQNAVLPHDQREDTFHVGAFSNGHLVCVATFHEDVFPELKAERPYRLRGMGTNTAFHGQGLGRMVLEYGLQILRERGCDLMWCNAREAAFPFYERLGLQYLGDMFDITGIGPHKVMYIYLR